MELKKVYIILFLFLVVALLVEVFYYSKIQSPNIVFQNNDSNIHIVFDTKSPDFQTLVKIIGLWDKNGVYLPPPQQSPKSIRTIKIIFQKSDQQISLIKTSSGATYISVGYDLKENIGEIDLNVNVSYASNKAILSKENLISETENAIRFGVAYMLAGISSKYGKGANGTLRDTAITLTKEKPLSNIKVVQID